MIDAKDLMIGNWLYDKVLEKPIQFNNLPYGIDLSNREGIEVTEEMLEKIGFVKKHRAWRLLYLLALLGQEL